MSICVGCLLAAGSFAGISGLGRVTEWLAEHKRQRAMQSVLDEAPPSDEQPERQPEPSEAREARGGDGGA
jgi:hypothetical protein